MGTLREWVSSRWLAGSLALVGVLLVLPSVLAPTWEMAVADRQHGSLLSRQWEWSWGRVRVTGLEGVELRDVWNPLGLGVLVVLLVAALGGVAVWVSLPIAWGRVAGLVTVALLTGRVLTTVSDRVGHSLGEVDQGASGLTVRTEMTQAGSLETAAAVVLLVALALLLTTGIRSARRADIGVAVPERDTGLALRTVRRGPVGDPGGLRPLGEHLSTPPVELVESEEDRR